MNIDPIFVPKQKDQFIEINKPKPSKKTIIWLDFRHGQLQRHVPNQQ